MDANWAAKPYCKNCYHDPHGSTDMDACNHQGYRAKPDHPSRCGCKSYIKWSRQDQSDEDCRLADECEARLAKENGMENHPKRSKLWYKAWEHGHSGGFPEIENWYIDLIDLVK